MPKAIVLTQGQGKVDARVRNLAETEFPPSEISLRVEYSSLNYKDALAILRGEPVVRTWPMVPGIDGAGVVERSASPSFKVGDRVTGAAGGVGSVAITLLAGRGFKVVASTGRMAEAPYLKALGAAEVIDRVAFSAAGRPLGRERWAGVVDSVGSHTLANACASTRYGGVVVACGLAQGMDLPLSVAPFILRGVTLAGVDSVMAPLEARARAWARAVEEIDLTLLNSLSAEVNLASALEAAPRLLGGGVRGRLVVNVND